MTTPITSNSSVRPEHDTEIFLPTILSRLYALWAKLSSTKQTLEAALTSDLLMSRPYNTWREIISSAVESIPHRKALLLERTELILAFCINTGVASATPSAARTFSSSVSVSQPPSDVEDILTESPPSPRLSSSPVSASEPHWLMLPIRTTDATPIAIPRMVSEILPLRRRRFFNAERNRSITAPPPPLPPRS